MQKIAMETLKALEELRIPGLRYKVGYDYDDDYSLYIKHYLYKHPIQTIQFISDFELYTGHKRFKVIGDNFTIEYANKKSFIIDKIVRFILSDVNSALDAIISTFETTKNNVIKIKRRLGNEDKIRKSDRTRSTK